MDQEFCHNFVNDLNLEPDISRDLGYPGFCNTNHIGKIAVLKLFFSPKHFSCIRWIHNIYHWNVDDIS